MKKILALILALLMILGTFAACDKVIVDNTPSHGDKGEKESNTPDDNKNNKDEAQIPQGEKGDKGEDGEDGKNGKDGEGGKDGISIQKTEIIDGCLWVTYSNAPENPVNLGVVATNLIDACGLDFYPLPDGTYGVMAGRSKFVEKINVPPTYNGKAVTRILPDAFKDSSNLKQIMIPDSITSIGENAFNGCTALASATISNSVTNIGNFAFGGCDSLTSVTIPNSVTSIGDSAFYNCTGLTSVYYDGDIASWRNINLVGSGANPLSNGAELYFKNISGEYELLTNLEIPSGVTEIKQYEFIGCTSLTSVTIPNSVTSIGNSAFSGCTGLTSVTIGNSVTSIGNYAFSGCTGLTSVTIPDNVTSIGDSAFNGCAGITNLTIGNGVTSIGDYAFNGCAGLTEINFNATAMNGLISFGHVFTNAGVNGNGITVNISANVTEIPSYLFGYDWGNPSAPKVTTVIFAAGSVCKSIGSSAFLDCTSLTSVKLPDSVTSIGYNAFRGCTNLTSISIPDSVTSIGDYAFRDCDSLTSIKYRGTEAEWNAITKGSDWNLNVPASCVITYNDTGE